MRISALPALLVCTLIACSCSVRHPPTIDDDFLDSSDFIPGPRAADSIRSLQEKLLLAPDDPEIHRRLAVCYRAIGTPQSRISSMNEIDEAIRLDPDNPVYRVERGLTLYARQFTGAAMRSLEKAAEIDPGNFYAWFHMGRIEKDAYLENMCFSIHLKDAIRYFGKANNIDGDHDETLFNLGLLQYLDGHLSLSAEYAHTGSDRHPSDYRFKLISAIVYLERRRFQDASAEFDGALALMDPAVRERYEDISLPLGEGESERYLNLDETNRRDFERRFWVLNDPTPATPVNERKLEHYRRIFLATELLTNDRLGLEGASTARGWALVSYGLPRKMLFNMGSGLDGPFVVWSYLIGGKMFRLYFQDEFLNGNYHISIDKKFSDRAMITEGILRSIPQMYTYPVEYPEIPLTSRTAQFKGKEEMTRIEFSLGMPDSIFARRAGKHSMDFTLFDHDLNIFTTERTSFDPDTLPSYSKPSGGIRVLTTAIDVPVLQLESSFAVEITGESPPGRGLYRDVIFIRDFSGRGLGLSDLKLSLISRDDACSDLLDPAPIYASGSDLCCYYEIYGLERDEGDMARYRMTYTIAPQQAEDEAKGFSETWRWIKSSALGSDRRFGSLISSSIEQSINASSTTDNIRIDLGALEPGKYVLNLEIADLIADAAVSNEVYFAVIPRKGSL